MTMEYQWASLSSVPLRSLFSNPKAEKIVCLSWGLVPSRLFLGHRQNWFLRGKTMFGGFGRKTENRQTSLWKVFLWITMGSVPLSLLHEYHGNWFLREKTVFGGFVYRGFWKLDDLLASSWKVLPWMSSKLLFLQFLLSNSKLSVMSGWHYRTYLHESMLIFVSPISICHLSVWCSSKSDSVVFSARVTEDYFSRDNLDIFKKMTSICNCKL